MAIWPNGCQLVMIQCHVMKIQDINVTVIYTGVSCQNGKQVEFNVTITIILHLFIIKSEKSTIQIHQLLLLQHRNMYVKDDYVVVFRLFALTY